MDEVQQGTDIYALKAVGYLNSMETFSTYFGLKLGHLIFSATEQLSLNLQAKDTTIQEAIQCSNLTLQFLQRQRTDEAFDSFYHRMVNEGIDLTDPPALPRNRRHELEMYSQDVNLPKLKVQLKMVPDLIRAFNAAHPDRSVKEVTTLRTFSDILNAMPSTKLMFDEVARLLQIS